MNPVYVALDTPELSQALAMAERVAPHVGGLKLGKEFLAANGPQALLELKRFGLPIFADTKFHDIPKTVAGAVRATAKLGVHIVNVHASGGEAMLKAARDATKDVDPATKIIAVTVLTSMSDADLAAVGQATPARDQVLRLATLTRACGLDGVVCSAHEIGRASCRERVSFLV